jgi:hypothetical protein
MLFQRVWVPHTGSLRVGTGRHATSKLDHTIRVAALRRGAATEPRLARDLPFAGPPMLLTSLYNVATRGKFHHAVDRNVVAVLGVFQCCRVAAGFPGNSDAEPAGMSLQAKDASAHAVVKEALEISALNVPDSAARQSRTARWNRLPWHGHSNSRKSRAS